MTGEEPSKETDRQKAKKHVEGLLKAMGLDPEDDEHLKETPRRVVESRFDELFRGLDNDPAEHLSTTFSDIEQYKGDAGWVILDSIQVQSMCAHHLLPFRGHAHVGYIPKEEAVGLSKLSRVVKGFARRPQVQERLTNQVATAVQENLDPVATVVVVGAEHECMALRGVQEPDASTTTSALRGDAHPTAGDDYKPELKDEFLSLIGDAI